MPVFTPSTINWPVAVQQVADSVGASGDTEMLARAHVSLRAAFQFLNGRYDWDFLRTEAVPFAVQPPFSVTGVSASAGQSSAACPAGHGFLADDMLIGSVILAGTRVTTTAASGFSFNTTAVISVSGLTVFDATGQRDLYPLPTDWKDVYSVRLLGTNKKLPYVGRRAYDVVVVDESTVSTVEGYDLFRGGSSGKLRLIPPPAGADVVQVRYYRRMFLASASGVATALDIHEDYESYPIAWAKWHFLTDKGEGRKDQATTWFALAQEGLKTMLADQTRVPDANLGFIPSVSSNSMLGDKSTRPIHWDY